MVELLTHWPEKVIEKKSNQSRPGGRERGCVAAGAEKESRGGGAARPGFQWCREEEKEGEGEGGRGGLEVEASLAGLLQVPCASLKGAQQVEAAQRVAGQGLGDLGDFHGRQRGVVGRVHGGAALLHRCLWPVGGD